MPVDQKDLLNPLVDSIPDLIFFKDDEGVYQSCNVAFCDFVGKPREEILGSTDYDLFPKGLADFFRDKDRIMMKEGQPRTNEEWVTYPDGREVLLETLKTPFLDPEKGPIGVLGISRDITEKHHLEKAFASFSQKLTLLYENAPYGFAFCDMDGNFVDVNETFCDIIGYSRQEALHMAYNDLMPESYNKQEADIRAELGRAGEYGPYECDYRRKDGSFIPVMISRFMVDDYDGRKGVWKIVQDISERKALEGEIEAERLMSLQAAKMAVMGEMSGAMAHEINNPLAIIVGNATVLTQQAQTGRYEDLEKRLAKIDGASQRIERIVRGLRRFSNKQTKEERAVYKVADIVEEAMDFIRASYKRHGIKIHFGGADEKQVFCDRMEIEQVLINLLLNAKDALCDHEDKCVTISVDSHGEKVIIRVSDTGKGVAPQDKDKLFTPFFTTKPSGEGTGLGLSIAQGIIKAHDGELYYTNENGHSSFIVELKEAA